MSSILFKKYAIIDKVVFYKLDNYIDQKLFFVGIDMTNPNLYFYDNVDFDNPIATIDLSDIDKPVDSIPGLSGYARAHIIIKLYKVFKEKKFPDYMVYQRT